MRYDDSGLHPLGGWWRRFRLRRIADPAFQRWAAGSPLTRGVARRRASALFDLCAGFVYSQVLHACVHLGVLERLREGALSASELAPMVDLPQAGCRRLLDAAAALDLLDALPGGRYGLGEQGAALLANPGVLAMVRHHALLYRDLADPVALLRRPEQPTELGSFWNYARRPGDDSAHPGGVAAYTELMSISQQLVAEDILDAYPLTRHRCLLDVAGGDGTFLRAVAQRAAGLRLMLLDLPDVANVARQRLAAAGLAERVEIFGRSFLGEPLPAGADVISLVRVLHDHNDTTARALLAQIRAALPRGGRLLLAEPLAGTRGAERMGDAYFGMYLLAMGSGRPRRAGELRAWLREAGFRRSRQLPTRRPLQVQVVIAET